MTDYRDGVAVVTTLTLSAGFAISSWDEPFDQNCFDRNQSCQIRYIPVVPKLPDQEHVPFGENLPTIPTTLSVLSASGGPMSNVNSQVSSSSSLEWTLRSSPNTFDYDEYMAERFRQAGINVAVQPESSKSYESSPLRVT